VKLRAYWRIAAQALLVAFQLQTVAKAGPPDSTPVQHFVCDIGYTLQQCHEAMDVLREVLAKYPTADLGEWTWVLLRPEDWRREILNLGFSPDSTPALTDLPKRKTFFEGALVKKISFRGAQLSKLWRMPIEDLLDLAVRHELGHALCNERNEAKAERLAAMLQARKPISCDVHTAKSSAKRLSALRSGTP
jgi:hypothetical protein